MENGASSYRRFRDEGDEQGLYEIIREYKDGLIFYLNSFVNNIHIAEELAEDTFVLLFTKKPKDKQLGSFKTWLYTIGRNVAIDYLRRTKRKSEKEVSFEETGDIIKDEENLEKTYIKKEKRIILHRAMKKLKPEHREILWLIYFEELSIKEASKVLKKTPHSLETLIYRARKSLRSQLETEGFTYEDF